jgi:hypothetical protein
MKKLREKSSYARDAVLAFFVMLGAGAMQRVYGGPALVGDAFLLISTIVFLASLYKVIRYKKYAETFKKKEE